MENNIYTPGQETTNSSPLPIPQITLESLGFHSETAKWTKFLAILGFIGIGVLLIAVLIMGVFFSVFNNSSTTTHFPFPLFWIGIIYFIVAAFYIFPLIYLNNFSNYMSKAVAFRDTEMLTIALENIKKHFKYIGIFTIAIIGSYLLSIIGALIFATV